MGFGFKGLAKRELCARRCTRLVFLKSTPCKSSLGRESGSLKSRIIICHVCHTQSFPRERNLTSQPLSPKSRTLSRLYLEGQGDLVTWLIIRTTSNMAYRGYSAYLLSPPDPPSRCGCMKIMVSRNTGNTPANLKMQLPSLGGPAYLGIV